ncbi:hypothetical protein ACFLXE_00030 [Chloroflexota bacterium]
MQDVRCVVETEFKEIEPQLREIGQRIGMALTAIFADTEHQPGWLLKRAHQYVSEYLYPIHEELNRTVGFPDDYIG